MAEKLTPQQDAAVKNRGGNLLVSAAAGSGKTKVLTERLLSYIIDPADPANIDDFLVITFTKAAAAELRVKIAEKLSDAIAADPDNQHLQKQMQRLHMAQISTVDSFCNDLLRQYTYTLDISPDFRMVDPSETPELQQRVLDQILERAYERIGTDPAFHALVETQGFGRNDLDIPSVVLKIYESSRCNLHPDKWLDWCQDTVNNNDYTDALETPWGQFLLSDFRKLLNMHINTFQNCKEAALKAAGMSKIPGILDHAIAQLKSLQEAKTWDELHEHRVIKFESLRFDKDCVDEELRGQIGATKETITKSVKDYMTVFDADNAATLKDLVSGGLAASGLIALVREFAEEYSKLKRSLRVMDFNDLEHKALDLLMGKSRSHPTALAREIGSRYREVMVDEYQDSNQVQDSIYSALTSEKNNCFMVGDVKQAIYQFRLAEPGIFIEKYNHYDNADEAKPGHGRRILLSDNFRSSGEIIDCVNDVFRLSMSQEVGGLDYGPDEQLREGVEHVSLGEPEVELLAVQTEDVTYYEEGIVIANRILELIDGTHMIRDKKTHQLRPVELQDIAILLRARRSWPFLKRALENAGIPFVTFDSEDVLHHTQITVLTSLLKTINNPMQDIPLVSVLCSSLFRFTADDMARLRGLDKYASVYQLLQMDTSDKSKNFLEVLDGLRRDSRIYSVCQLLDVIMQKTRFDSIYGAMADGLERMGHIQKFLKVAAAYESTGGKDLRQFIEHLDAAQEKGLADDSQVQPTSAVQVMTIHQSKGLEYPVVFCACLQRDISFKNINESKVLCDRDLGLGLHCIDQTRRVRYPSLSRRAVERKLKAETVSEDLRVLYVAMTRARDRLIMTYASKYLDKKIASLVAKLSLYDKSWISAYPGCPGTWVLQAALRRTEAGALFALGGNPGCANVSDKPWDIKVVTPPDVLTTYHSGETAESRKSSVAKELKDVLSFVYPYDAYTKIASKQTATQIKGRMKDIEVAQSAQSVMPERYYRKPTFVSGGFAGKEYGNAYHGVMQYICYEACDTPEKLDAELDRMEQAMLITGEQRKMINPMKIVNFVCSPIGQRLICADNVHREFKFSILTDLSQENTDAKEKVLLQGVVDCLMVEPDGITVVDFKSDRFDPADLPQKLEEHRPQVEAYANAVERIFRMPVKEKILYFFSIDQAVNL